MTMVDVFFACSILASVGAAYATYRRLEKVLVAFLLAQICFVSGQYMADEWPKARDKNELTLAKTCAKDLSKTLDDIVAPRAARIDSEALFAPLQRINGDGDYISFAVVNDPEARQLLAQIRRAFDRAGWAPSGEEYPEGKVDPKDFSVLAAYSVGLTFVAPASDESLVVEAEQLSALFSSHGLVSTWQKDEGRKSHYLQAVVGSKPMVGASLSSPPRCEVSLIK